MNTRTNTRDKTRKLAMYAMLAAVVIVLQIICTYIKFGPFSITLALTPIIIGAAIYGWKCGAFLGFVFSAVVYITGLMGLDGGFILMMMDYSAVGTTFICLFKGTAAGAVAGLIYKLVAKKSSLAASFVAGVSAPVVNTGLFALAMMTIFYGFLANNADAANMAAVEKAIADATAAGASAAEIEAAGIAAEQSAQSPIGMLFLAWIGVNFIVEFISNVALGAVITRVVAYFNKNIR